jgi:hypothetical protein
VQQSSGTKTGANDMTKTDYQAHRRSIRDNGLQYTINHADKLTGYQLAKLDILANQPDLLAWRVRWLAQPDTTRKNIIKLTSFIL